MINLYKSITNEDKILFTSRRSSELIKYASNSMLAMRIIFINEIADLCEKIGADVTDIAKGIGLDKRIGPHFSLNLDQVLEVLVFQKMLGH